MGTVTKYRRWLGKQDWRGDPVGDLARDAKIDILWDGTQKGLQKRVAGTAAEEAFIRSLDEYRQVRRLLSYNLSEVY